MATVSRFRLLNDVQWELISGLLPSNGVGVVILSGMIGGSWRASSTGIAPVCRGRICRVRNSARGRRCETTSPLRRRWHLGSVLMNLLAIADDVEALDWTVSVDATINRAHQHATNTTRPDQDTGALSNYGNLPLADTEPAGHGLGAPWRADHQRSTPPWMERAAIGGRGHRRSTQ